MNTRWLNFTGFPDQTILNQNFSDTQIKSSEEQKATYEKVASACDSWYAPAFADEVKPELAVAAGAIEVIPVDLKDSSETTDATTNSTDSKSLTIPPIKVEHNDLLNAILVGLGVVFVLKIID